MNEVSGQIFQPVVRCRVNLAVDEALVQFIFSHPAPVVQKVDNAIHRINLHPVDNPNDFFNTYPLDSDLSGGERYPTFAQSGPDV